MADFDATIEMGIRRSSSRRRPRVKLHLHPWLHRLWELTTTLPLDENSKFSKRAHFIWSGGRDEPIRAVYSPSVPHGAWTRSSSPHDNIYDNLFSFQFLLNLFRFLLLLQAFAFCIGPLLATETAAGSLSTNSGEYQCLCFTTAASVDRSVSQQHALLTPQ